MKNAGAIAVATLPLAIVLLMASILHFSDSQSPASKCEFFKTEEGWFYRWSERCQPVPVSSMFYSKDGLHLEIEETLNLMRQAMSRDAFLAGQVWLAHARRVTGSPEPFNNL